MGQIWLREMAPGCSLEERRRGRGWKQGGREEAAPVRGTQGGLGQSERWAGTTEQPRQGCRGDGSSRDAEPVLLL